MSGTKVLHYNKMCWTHHILCVKTTKRTHHPHFNQWWPNVVIIGNVKVFGHHFEGGRALKLQSSAPQNQSNQMAQKWILGSNTKHMRWRMHPRVRETSHIVHHIKHSKCTSKFLYKTFYPFSSEQFSTASAKSDNQKRIRTVEGTPKKKIILEWSSLARDDFINVVHFIIMYFAWSPRLLNSRVK